VLRALFPCGSITGAPKVRAMQIIAAQEAAPRGLYTGAFGWRAPEGELRLNVAIRTLEIAADGRGRLGIGSGIVADSDIEAEWQECCLKGHFLAELDPGLALIETLRLEVRAGRAHFPRAAGHVQRMLASAAWFAFPVTAAALEAALAAAASGRADGVYRLRLTLDKAGRLASQVHALQPEVPGPRWIVLAEERIAADDPLRRHKTTARAPYERALAAVQDRPEIFDVIFCNTRGELAEGARSTLFVRLAGQWLTPPLAAGALPGVLRAERLALGWAREACLWPADLLRAEAIECGNALRGGVPVRVWPADKFPQPAVEAPSP
jgi:para-aminobenzoate synthetase/4-amino-4-deoxychorismate lyase